MQHTDYTHLVRVRELLAHCDVPLETLNADLARERIRAANKQLDDYILPRAGSLDAPLTVVVGGSTGAGKSTLVNSLLGEPLTRAGAIRPTTRQPVLLHRSEDAPYLGSEHYLPSMRHHSVAAGETVPGADAHTEADVLVTLQTQTVPPGIALIDAPDIDSVSEQNRRLAKDLLSAADLWLFVTTANRYADAVPWELLHRAAERNITVAVVLNRVPEGAEHEIEEDLQHMLSEAGIAPALLVCIPEQKRDNRGLLPPAAIDQVRNWLEQLGADAPARAAIARRTLSGAINGLSEDLQVIAAEQKSQHETLTRLSAAVDDAYDTALENIREAASDGTLLRGEVLMRWQDFVGTGEFFRSLESGIGRLRDRLVGIMRGTPAQAAKVEQALEHGLHAVAVDAAARAAEQVRRSWGSERPGALLLEEHDAGVTAEQVQTEQSTFETQVAEQIRAWQQGILETIRAEGAGKRQRARVLSLGVNAAAVLLMVAVFSATGGLTGLEIGIAGGSGVVGSKLLESVFGEDAARRMAQRARIDLIERMQNLLDAHRQRFTDSLNTINAGPEPAQVLEAAQQTRHIGHELAVDGSPTGKEIRG